MTMEKIFDVKGGSIALYEFDGLTDEIRDEYDSSILRHHVAKYLSNDTLILFIDDKGEVCEVKAKGEPIGAFACHEAKHYCLYHKDDIERIRAKAKALTDKCV